jgi:hypothetical protein
MGTDAECRVEDAEPLAKIIDADEGIPAAHGKEHLFYLMQSTLRCNVFLKCHQNVNMRRISPKEISDKTKLIQRVAISKKNRPVYYQRS